MVPLKLQDDVESVDDTLGVVSVGVGVGVSRVAREDLRECSRERSAGC
jgi:hypothetical protein